MLINKDFHGNMNKYDHFTLRALIKHLFKFEIHNLLIFLIMSYKHTGNSIKSTIV